MLGGLRRPEVLVILRWAAHIPTFMAMCEHGYYSAAASVGHVGDLPNGQTFLQGLKVAGITTLVVFPWNFVMFGAAGYLAVEASDESTVFALIGSVDLLLAFVLSIGIIQQAQYLPTDLGSCDNAVHWRAQQNDRSFFALAKASGKFVDVGDDEGEICRAMVGGWALTIAIIGYLIIACMANFNMAFDFSRLDADAIAWVADSMKNRIKRARICFDEKVGRLIRRGHGDTAKDTQTYTAIDSDDELSTLGVPNKDEVRRFEDHDDDEVKGTAERPRDSFEWK